MIIQGILKKQATAAYKNGLQAIVAVSPENVAYTAGFPVPSQHIPIRQRFFACVVTAKGDSAMLVADMEESQTRSDSCITNIRSYDEWVEDPIEILAEILHGCGVHGGRIGIELDFLPAEYRPRLEDALPQAVLVNCEDLMGKLRMVKTPAEIEKLRRVGRAAENAHYAAARQVGPGATEMDLAQYIYSELLTGGVESIRMVVIGSGERSQHANPVPTMRKMQPGDLVRTDLYATIGGYLSDVARTMVVGKPNGDQKATWDTLTRVQHSCLEMIRPGAQTADIYRHYARTFEQVGLRPLRFLGHGLGLTLHEGPYINKYTNATLEEGMVLCIEPFHILPGVGGYQLEDEVIVTADGYELITNQHSSAALIEII